MAPTDPEAARALARARSARWKAANREKLLASSKAYYRVAKARNPEKLRAQQQAQNVRRRERYRDDPEYRDGILRRAAARYSADPEPAKERARQYNAEHRDDLNAKGKVKRATPSYQEKQRARHMAWRTANSEHWKANLRKYRQDNPERMHAYDSERRARVKGAPIVEKVDRAVVAERDGWICQLCGKVVDPTLAYPDPMSKSLDHRVALKPRKGPGGDHSYANCQLAHLRCNRRKWRS